jgi:hypothetical protein
MQCWCAVLSYVACLAVHCFHNVSNCTIFERKKVIGNEMCVLIFPTTFAWNISHSKGPGVAQWLRHCATSRTVPGPNPDGVGRREFSRGYRQNGVPCPLKLSNREFSWEGGWCVMLTTYHPCSAECQVLRGLNLPGPPSAISTPCCGWPLPIPISHSKKNRGRYGQKCVLVFV